MLSTPHILVGAAIVKAIPNPVISLPLAFLSHFALDSIPHWDGSPKAPFNKKTSFGIIADYAFGLTILYLLTSGLDNQTLIILGGFLGTLPDFILGTYRHFVSIFSQYSFVRIPNEFHMTIQRNVTFWPGLVISIITSAISILILIYGKAS